MNLFLIRFLKVLWVLSGIFFAFVILTSNDPYILMVLVSENPDEWVLIGLLWYGLLMVVQYLLFSSYAPTDLFDGTLSEKYHQK